MPPEVTYDWYAREYKGALKEESFEAALPRAAACVRARCVAHDAERLTDRELDAYRRAVCAACEAVDDPAAVSWKSGSASRELVDPAANSIDSVIERELSGTRLASCWV